LYGHDDEPALMFQRTRTRSILTIATTALTLAAGIASAQAGQRNAYDRAFAACMEARGYTVK